MNWQLVVMMLALSATALSTTLAIYLYRRRNNVSARYLMYVMAALAIWSFGYSMDYGSNSLAAKYFWSRFQYPGVVLAAPCWLAFALSFPLDGRPISKKSWALLLIIPTLSLILCWTNEWHHLFVREVTLATDGPLPLLRYVRGPFFWVLVAYSYVLLVSGSVILLRSFFRAKGLSGRQLALLLAGLSVPWLANALYISGLSLFKHLDLTPFGLTVTGLIFTVGLFRLRLLSLPLAGRAVIESIRDGLLILDQDKAIIDHNAPARSMLVGSGEPLGGRDIIELLPDLARDFNRLPEDGLWRRRVSVGAAQDRRHLEIDLSRIRDRRSRSSGFLMVIHDATSRLETEVALRASEKQFRELVENLDELVFTLDEGGLIQYVSPACLDVIGLGQEEFIGRLFTDFIYDDDRPMVMKQYHKMLQGQGRPTEYRVIHATKGPRWVRSSSRPLLEEGRVVGVQGVITDIDQRKKAEEAMRASEVKYRHLVKNAPAGIYEIDFTSNRFLSVNEVICELTGYSEEEMLAMAPLDILTEESQQVFLERLVKFQEGEVLPTSPEYQIKSKDGREIWIQLHVTYTYYQGAIKGSTVVAHDISERKAIEESLREWEAKYRTVLENASDGIIVTEMGQTVFVNQRVEELTGYSSSQLSLFSAFDLIQDKDLAQARDRYQRILNGETFSDFFEYRIRNVRGEYRWVASRSVLIDWEGRKAILTYINDVTDRKAAEKEKARLEAQLRQSQKMEAVGTLASGIAHDFNNILQALFGCLDLLSGYVGKIEPVERLLSEMNRSMQRAADLVNRLLTFSRQVEARLRPTDLNREVLQAVNILERTIPKMIKVETDLDENLEPVNGDPGQLEQVLLNMGANAKDAMPDGGRLLITTRNVDLDDEYCAARPELKPGPYARLTISDNGLGMDQQTLEHLFEPFFTTKRLGQGTGLGLAMVYGIIQSHGGVITCESGPGQGSTFHIHLPRLVGVKISAKEPSEYLDEPAGGDETVLVVDDEGSIRYIAKEILESQGYKVLTADSGEEALEVYSNNFGTVDLVLLDLGMPGMGGRACLKALLEMDPQVRVIIASGYLTDNRDNDAQSRGARGFLKKPYHLQALLGKIREILDEPQDR